MIHLMVLTVAAFVGGTSAAGLALHPRKNNQPSKAKSKPAEKISFHSTLNTMSHWQLSTIGSNLLQSSHQIPITEIIVKPDTTLHTITVHDDVHAIHGSYSSVINKLGETLTPHQDY